MSRWITLARIVRPRGLKGEVIAESESNPERIQAYPRLTLDPPGDPCRIESAWEHQGRLVLKFAGVDSLEHAETLRDAEVRAPAEDRPPAPAGEHYLEDLIGCTIIDGTSGEPLGQVADCLEYGGPLLLQVKRDKRELLIPFVRDFCKEIDIHAKRITVELPEGLKDL